MILRAGKDPKINKVVRIFFDGEGEVNLKYVRVPFGTKRILFEVHPAYVSHGNPVIIIDDEKYIKPFAGRIGFGYQFIFDVGDSVGIFRYHLLDLPFYPNEKVILSNDFSGEKIQFENSNYKKTSAFQIPPSIGEQNVDPNCICLQTVVAKWMGPIEQWDKHLLAAATSGYNMIHFTPLQTRGSSDSPFSIKDHLTMDPKLIPSISTLKKKLKWMKSIGLNAMIDVVWNHVSSDAEWLPDHPESTYSPINSPRLKSASELDDKIQEFGKKMIGSHLSSMEEVRSLVYTDFKTQVIDELKLWEYFVIINVPTLVDEIVQKIVNHDPKKIIETSQPLIINDGRFDRGSVSINAESIVAEILAESSERCNFINSKDFMAINQERMMQIQKKVQKTLEEKNLELYREYDRCVDKILTNVYQRIVYERIEDDGPRLGMITDDHPLVQSYFTRRYCPKINLWVSFANNGWIWDADPLVNFAEEGDAYLTRSIIIWADCVKLNYGQCPQENPWLWEYMATYTKNMAELFDAFRLDNCHSTPMHVSKYFLEIARSVKPNIWVVAELFTNDSEVDKYFVVNLGIDSLIREAMAASSAEELSKMVTTHGGFYHNEHLNLPPCPNFLSICLDKVSKKLIKWGHSVQEKKPSKCTNLEISEQMISTHPHTLFMDCTHDNKTPSELRTKNDALCNSAIISMCLCAIGSVRGYDEFCPRRLNIVKDVFKYPSPDFEHGLWKIRKRLSDLHFETQNCNQIYLKLIDNEVFVMEKKDSTTDESIILIGRTAFQSSSRISIRPPKMSDQFEIIFAADILDDHDFTIKGRDQLFPIPQSRVSITESTDVALAERELHPGSIIVLQKRAVANHKKMDFSLLLGPIVKEMSFNELHHLMYGSREEGYPVYHLPGKGDLPYSGIYSFHKLLKGKYVNSLEENVSQGNWAIDFILDRVNDEVKKNKIESLAEIVKVASEISRFEIFCQFITSLYEQSLISFYSKMPVDIQRGSSLIRTLALGSIQLMGQSQESGLFPVQYLPILVPNDVCAQMFKRYSRLPSLAAGLPHFSKGHMRVWGRDTFISMPGLLLRTGRFEEARAHLIAFASCFLNGLLPNLLDEGKYPRFNSRDTVWWFLNALKKFCTAVKSTEILREKIAMRFSLGKYTKIEDYSNYTKIMTIWEVIIETLRHHVEGISFREWNAGPQLDAHMKDAGFDIKISMDRKTGLIKGGSEFNCGTWMDKMGSAPMNKGIPATPRNGAPIECTALVASILEWLSEKSKFDTRDCSDQYLYETGVCGIEFKDWLKLIRDSFDSTYRVIPIGENDVQYYKDTDISTQWRPNYLVAISVVS